MIAKLYKEPGVQQFYFIDKLSKYRQTLFFIKFSIDFSSCLKKIHNKIL